MNGNKIILFLISDELGVIYFSNDVFPKVKKVTYIFEKLFQSVFYSRRFDFNRNDYV